MPADLVWYESDGVTPLGELVWGSVAPGQSYYGKNGAYLQAVIKNDGDASANVEVSIVAVGTNVEDDYVRIAQGDPTPGAFVSQPTVLSLGALAPAATARIWADLVAPVDAPLAGTTSARLAANEV